MTLPTEKKAHDALLQLAQAHAKLKAAFSQSIEDLNRDGWDTKGLEYDARLITEIIEYLGETGLHETPGCQRLRQIRNDLWNLEQGKQPNLLKTKPIALGRPSDAKNVALAQAQAIALHWVQHMVASGMSQTRAREKVARLLQAVDSGVTERKLRYWKEKLGSSRPEDALPQAYEGGEDDLQSLVCELKREKIVQLYARALGIFK